MFMFSRRQASKRRDRRTSSRMVYLEAIEGRILMAGTPSQLLFTVQPSQVAVGSPEYPSIQVSIADASGLTVTTDTSTVTLRVFSGPTGGTITGTTAVRAVNGVANFTNVSFTTVGSYTILATDGTLNNASSNTFAVTAAPTQLVYVTSPVSTTAGQVFPSSIQVAVEDAGGNIVTSDHSTVTLSIASGPTGGSITGTISVVAVNGIATFNGITLPKAGSYRLAVRDGSLAGATSSTFTVSPGIAASLSFGQQPLNTPQSAVVSPAPVVNILDAFGNIVTSDTSTITLNVISGPSGASIDGTNSLAAVAGAATFSNISFSQLGIYVLQASDGSLTVNSAAFAVTGPASQLGFVHQPSQATVGTSVPNFTVAIEDAAGNVIANDTSPITIAILSGSGSVSGTTTVNAVNGVATFSGISLSGTGNYVLQASSGALTVGMSNQFLINGTAAKLEFITQPADSAANAPITNTVRIQVEDVDGNVVINNNSLVTISIASGPAGATLTGNTAVNASSGIATFTNLIPSAAGSYTLLATDGALVAATSSSFTVAPSASKVVFITQPSNVAQGSSMFPSVVVWVENDNGNKVTTNTSSVSLAIIDGPAGGSMSGTTTVAAVAGVATFSNLSFNRQGTYTLLAHDGSLATDTSVSFVVTALPSKLGVGTQPANTLAGTILAPFTFRIRDVDGNVVPTDRSTVTLSIASGPTGGAIIGNATAAAVNGVVTFSNVHFNVAGTYTLTASDGALTSISTRSFVISPDTTSAHLVVGSGPTSTLVGKANSTPLVVNIVDQFGNIVTNNNTPVTVSVESGPGTLSGTRTVGASHGVATFRNLKLSTAGSYTLLLSDSRLATAQTTSTYALTVTPAISTLARPSVSSSYVINSAINLSTKLSSLVAVPVNFTGTVSLVQTDGNPFPGTVATTLSTGGTVKINITSVPAGTYTVKLVYSGDTNHTGAASPAFTLVVGGTRTTLSASDLNITTSEGLTLTAKVSPIRSSSVARTGNVVFKDGATDIGTVTLTSSTAVLTLPALSFSAGTHILTAVYAGDANYDTSTSASLTLVVT